MRAIQVRSRCLGRWERTLAKQLCNRGGVVTEPVTPAQGQWEGWQLAWSLPSKGRTVPDQGWGELARKARRGMWFKAKKMCDLTGWSWEGKRWRPQHPCRFYCYSHFTGRKTEAQKGAISCPRSVSQGSEPELIQVWLTQKFSHCSFSQKPFHSLCVHPGPFSGFSSAPLLLPLITYL